MNSTRLKGSKFKDCYAVFCCCVLWSSEWLRSLRIFPSDVVQHHFGENLKRNSIHCFNAFRDRADKGISCLPLGFQRSTGARHFWSDHEDHFPWQAVPEERPVVREQCFFFRWTKWSGRKLFKWRGIPRQRSLKYYMEDTQFMQARETFIYVPARSRLNGHQGFKGLELWFVSRLKSDINPVTKPFLVRRGKRLLSRPIASFFDSICFPKLQSHYHINCSSVQGLRQWSRSKSSPPKALCFLESSCQRSQRSCNSCKAFWTCSGSQAIDWLIWRKHPQFVGFKECKAWQFCQNRLWSGWVVLPMQWHRDSTGKTVTWTSRSFVCRKWSPGLVQGGFHEVQQEGWFCQWFWLGCSIETSKGNCGGLPSWILSDSWSRKTLKGCKVCIMITQ